jgi:protein arginine N-methyltransferase 5
MSLILHVNDEGGLGVAQLQPTVILANANTGVHAKGGPHAYSQYVRHLEKTSPAVIAAQTAGTVENFAQGYQDYLQAPLQVRAAMTGGGCALE